MTELLLLHHPNSSPLLMSCRRRSSSVVVVLFVSFFWWSISVSNTVDGLLTSRTLSSLSRVVPIQSISSTHSKHYLPKQKPQQEQYDEKQSTTTTSLRMIFSSKSSSSSSSSSSLSPLPKGLSPFEKSLSKSLDLQGTFRQLAVKAVERGLRDGTVTKMELEFPPLAGGDLSKSQFDDFDNLSELDANRDWCVQFLPMLAGRTSLPKNNNNKNNNIWLVFPDDKECELAKTEWTGQRYQSAGRFTSIRAAVTAVLEAAQNENGDQKTTKNQMTLPWGTTLASTVNKVFQGGDGILADSSTLDDLDAQQGQQGQPRFHLVCQPGNGGPVEDWINVQTLHQVSAETNNKNNLITTCIVNGALDKVRDGYYPSIFFPALAATKSFYNDFEAMVFCKPIADKGLYGWLYRVYPEPWQVILQTAVVKNNNNNNNNNKKKTETVNVQNTVALVSDERPTYQEAVAALVKAAANVATTTTTTTKQ